MSSSSSENDTNTSTEEVVKRKMGRPITAPWRHNTTNGKYDHRCNDPEYYKLYYRNKLSVKVTCPLCLCETGKQKLLRHQETALCKKNRNDMNIVIV